MPVKVEEGSLDKYPNFESKFVEPRTVHVWLPDNYSADKRYAVVYMQDGQSLFDAATNWNGKAWEVDITAAKLNKDEKIKDFIVVGIFNGQERRFAEYFPQKAFEKIPKKDQQLAYDTKRKTGEPLFGKNKIQSDNYLKFMVDELKPFIDKKYSVHSDKKNTFVVGSSMGGLISLYAINEYPDVFGAAACLSTHWLGLVPESPVDVESVMAEYLRESLPSPKDNRIYFDYGTKTLDAFYPPMQKNMDKIMREKGFGGDSWITKKFEGAAHDEVSWGARLAIPLTFLLQK